MGRIIINKFAGINSSLASLQLKPGEFQSSQNLRGRPFDNYSKRQGVDPSSVQDSPVMGIFEIELDGVTIPLIQSQNQLEFNPDIGSPDIPNPDPFPVDDPLDPG